MTHKVALNRVLPTLGTRRVDELDVEDVNEAVAILPRRGASGRRSGSLSSTWPPSWTTAASTRTPPATRGTVDYHSTSRRFVLNGSLDAATREALRQLELD